RHTASRRPDATAEARATALRSGMPAPRVAADALEEAGFRIGRRKHRVPRAGVILSFVAEDTAGALWYFDVVGAFTSHRGGMLRTDAVGRALGRAAAVNGRLAGAPLVLLTTDLPRRPSEADTALHAVGPRVVFDVVDVLSTSGRERLARYAKG